MINHMKLAVDAKLPLIAVSTSDILNVSDVLVHLIDKSVSLYDSKKVEQDSVYYTIWTKGTQAVASAAWASIYLTMTKQGSSLIVVNLTKVPDEFHSAGELPTPKALIHRLVVSALPSEDGVPDSDGADKLLPVFSGLTLKDAVELLRLTVTMHGKLGYHEGMATRGLIAKQTRGMTLVHKETKSYLPPAWLENWVNREKPFFLGGEDVRLIPRGLLFDGNPGTGKSEASKWIAHKMGVPLFRIDVGLTKEKWVGSSENNLLQVLTQLDHLAPCVALFDEIEKMIGGAAHDSSGVSSSMLGQLLWWLAEREERVLVIMTTNDMKRLPLELYRPGRIDEVMYFAGLEKLSQVQTFAEHVIKQFDYDKQPDKQIVFEAMALLYKEAKEKVVPHALVERRIYQLVKQQLMIGKAMKSGGAQISFLPTAKLHPKM